MGDDDKLSIEETAKALGEIAQAEQMQREDLLGELGYEPEKAADAIWEIFQNVMWKDDPTEDDKRLEEEEYTPEEMAKRREEWKAEMAVFWKKMDQLQDRMMSYPDRPEFNPD